MIMVNQAENLVIVQWSTWPQAEPSFSAQPLEASLMFSAIAKEPLSLQATEGWMAVVIQPLSLPLTLSILPYQDLK